MLKNIKIQYHASRKRKFLKMYTLRLVKIEYICMRIMEKQSVKVILCLGSNVNAEANIKQAQLQLSTLLKDMRWSVCRWTEPIGISGSGMFLNCITVSRTSMDFTVLNNALKKLERSLGRRPEDKKIGQIPIDIDILEYGGKRYHEADWKREYITELIKSLHEEN